jgi:hypothetical protein
MQAEEMGIEFEACFKDIFHLSEDRKQKYLMFARIWKDLVRE